MLINVKMPTIVGNLTLITMLNATSVSLEAGTVGIFQQFISYELLKELLAIRRIFSLVAKIKNIKFSNFPNVFKIDVVQQ